MQISKSKALKTIKLAVLPVLIAISMGSANAASDGAISEVNTSGQLFVTAEILPVISITGLDDITLGVISPGLNLGFEDKKSASETFCVYTNAANFNVSVASERGRSFGEFGMSGAGSGGSLKYTVDMDFGDTLGGLNPFGYSEVSKDINSEQSYGPFFYNTDTYNDFSCNSDDGLQENIRITINISGEDAAAALPDNYTDVITIVAEVAAPIPT